MNLEERVAELEKHCRLLQEQLDMAMFEKHELKLDTIRLTDRLEDMINELGKELTDYSTYVIDLNLKAKATLHKIADVLEIKL